MAMTFLVFRLDSYDSDDRDRTGCPILHGNHVILAADWAKISNDFHIKGGEPSNLPLRLSQNPTYPTLTAMTSL